MYENLIRSFYALESDFDNWINLADHPRNPHRWQDLLTGAEILGKMAQTSNILEREYNTPAFKNHVTEAREKVQKLIEILETPVHFESVKGE